MITAAGMRPGNTAKMATTTASPVLLRHASGAMFVRLGTKCASPFPRDSSAHKHIIVDKPKTRTLQSLSAWICANWLAGTLRACVTKRD